MSVLEAFADEGVDHDYVAGWNAYLRGEALPTGPGVSALFEEGYEKARKAYEPKGGPGWPVEEGPFGPSNGRGETPTMRRMTEVEPSELG